MVKKPLSDGAYLGWRFAFGEDDFGDAVAQGAMMVDLRKTEVFKGHVTHARHRIVNRERAFAYLFEQRAKMLLIHDVRISKLRVTPIGPPRTRNRKYSSH